MALNKILIKTNNKKQSLVEVLLEQFPKCGATQENIEQLYLDSTTHCSLH